MTMRRLQPVADFGFRRITAVRMWEAPHGPARFEVEGVVHRHPVTLPITPRIAARLIASGVPLMVRHTSD